MRKNEKGKKEMTSLLDPDGNPTRHGLTSRYAD